MGCQGSKQQPALKKFLAVPLNGTLEEVERHIERVMIGSDYYNPLIRHILPRSYINQLAEQGIFTEYLGHDLVSKYGSYRFIRYDSESDDPFAIYREVYSEYHAQIGVIYNWVPEFFKFILDTYPNQEWDLLQPSDPDFFEKLYQEAHIKVLGRKPTVLEKAQGVLKREKNAHVLMDVLFYYSRPEEPPSYQDFMICQYLQRELFS